MQFHHCVYSISHAQCTRFCCVLFCFAYISRVFVDSLKQNCHNHDDIFVTGCTGSCRFWSTFSSLAAPEAVVFGRHFRHWLHWKLSKRVSSVANDEKCRQNIMMTFPFQYWYSSGLLHHAWSNPEEHQHWLHLKLSFSTVHYPWWRHQMETFSALLAICAGIHRGPVNSPHKDQWRGALMFSLICVWINGWVNNREAGDLRRYRAHYDVTVMHWGDRTLM